MGLGMDMGRDELLEDHAAFIAGEIGGAVVELIIGGMRLWIVWKPSGSRWVMLFTRDC